MTDENTLVDELEYADGDNNPAAPPFFELSRLMVVAIDSNKDNQLVWNAQTGPDAPWGAEWTSINTNAYITLATGSTTDGRVAMVAQTRDAPQTMQYIDEAPQGPNNEERWNSPFDLGMPQGVAGLISPVMTRDADGRIEVFAVDGQSGTVWWIYQNPPKLVEKTEEITPPGQKIPVTVHVLVPEAPDQPWSDWQKLSGMEAGELSLANNADGRIVLIATDTSPDQKTVSVIQQKTGRALSASDWTAWERIDNPSSGPSSGQPVAALDAHGAINIFMVSDYNQITQLRQTSPGALTWDNWIRPGMLDVDIVNCTTGLDGNGNLILFGVDTKNGVHANYQTSPLFQDWSGWRKIAIAPGTGLLGTDYGAFGEITFFLSDHSNDSLHMISQPVIGATSWQATFSLLATGGLFTYGVVRDLTPPGVG